MHKIFNLQSSTLKQQLKRLYPNANRSVGSNRTLIVKNIIYMVVRAGTYSASEEQLKSFSCHFHVLTLREERRRINDLFSYANGNYDHCF